MIIKEIPFDSVQYEAMRRFREETLRMPLGLRLSEEDVQDEDQQIHIAALDEDGSIVGTVLLKPLSQSRVKLRQMAVSPSLRRSGIGTELVQFAEKALSARGFHATELHARTYAQGFYEKLGYRTEGAVFIEVTLPTIRMLKP